MAFPLSGSVAVLTGAASGIGAALAAELAARGTHLALIDRDAPGLAAIAEAARARGVTVSDHLADLADPGAIATLPQQVLASHGRANILINNAGVALMGDFGQVAPADMEWLFDINFWAPVRLTRAFLYLLRREEAAHIVNISSLFGIVAPPGQTAYCASKFALRGFSESLRHELAGSPITLTVVHPGGVRTAIADNARVPQGIDPEDARRAKAEFNNFLRTAPADAARQIAHAIERRAPRLLIGNDARLAERVQRLFPASYWRRLARRAGAGPKAGAKAALGGS